MNRLEEKNDQIEKEKNARLIWNIITIVIVYCLIKDYTLLLNVLQYMESDP